MLVQRNKIEEFCYALEFDSFFFLFSVDRISRGDGLALYLCLSINYQIIDYSNNQLLLKF